MKVVSVNVGLPREVAWRGEQVTTSIFKEPVSGPVTVRQLNLDGDRQSDLTVHGGTYKAVYAYPAEHYSFWQSELPDMDLPWSMFGENLTVAGLLESEVCVGDVLRVGTAELMVAQPRLPCYKLELRFGRTDMIKRFLASRLTGVYFSVLQEGELSTGDTLRVVSRDKAAVSIAEFTELYIDKTPSPQLLERVVTIEALPDSWRDHFQAQLDKQRRRAV